MKNDTKEIVVQAIYQGKNNKIVYYNFCKQTNPKNIYCIYTSILKGNEK